MLQQRHYTQYYMVCNATIAVQVPMDLVQELVLAQAQAQAQEPQVSDYAVILLYHLLLLHCCAALQRSAHQH